MEKDTLVETGEKTVEDLRNENDISIALMKRKRVHYNEYDEFAGIEEDADTSFESSWSMKNFVSLSL